MAQTASARAPSTAELGDAAIEISGLLREAKVDAPLRAKALAAILVAAMCADLDVDSGRALRVINRNVALVLSAQRVLPADRRRLVAALRLAGADFDRLAPFVGRIAAVLERVGLRDALRSNFDALGVFYEAFLRYGHDNNALGIVFTPRHITRFCVDLVGVAPEDRVIDIACGTGGFLVAAHEAVRSAGAGGFPQKRTGDERKGRARQIYGFDTNPTVWALASLNLLFRGDGASRIRLGSCFDPKSRREVRQQFTRAFLNPPFSQGAEPERDFIDATMETLVPGGRCAVVVKAGIFADEEHARWRAEFSRRHSVLAVISVPDDVFYPTAAPASILVAEAHVPQPDDAPVLMARVWNDGFEKLKNKRVEREGGELPEVSRCFHAMLAGEAFTSPLAATVRAGHLQGGAEWSPQEWLPQPRSEATESRREQQGVVAGIFRAVAEIPELADVVLEDFTQPWQTLPPLPLGQQGTLRDFFHMLNGKSAGEKHYREPSPDDGERVPYVSSGGTMNSIVGLVKSEADEVFGDGGITVTAFGQAAIQPWRFLARGNGGSAVRVLVPRYRMGIAELAWFAAQINAQQWRFFYARMAIKSRIERLRVISPPMPLPEVRQGIGERIREFRQKLAELSDI